MPTRKNLPNDRPNIGTTPFLEGLQALEGEEMPADQDAVLEPDEIEGRRVPTMTELDRLESSGGPDPDADGLAGFGGLADDGMRDEETDDPEVAAQEGMPWVPPIDPPAIAPDGSDEEGVLLSEEGDLNDRIREALRADSATSRFADDLVIAVVGSTAIIRGNVDDIDDSDSIVAVAELVPGIDEVRDETVFPGL